jgi:hypothetical protein
VANTIFPQATYEDHGAPDCTMSTSRRCSPGSSVRRATGGATSSG